MTPTVTPIRATNFFAQHADVQHVVDGREILISGPLSVRTSELVRSQLTHAIECGEGDLLVRLDGAEICDATGLGVLMGAHHRATRRGRRLTVAGASPRLSRLLRATKLDRIIEQYDAPQRYRALAS